LRHRSIALALRGDASAAGAELAAIERIGAPADFTAMQAANIPAKEVVTIAAHVLRARIGQLFSR